ncbi:MAG: single-stranded-DNA-specific exonuclease RecJ [Bacteroidetes bacterium]|nr:single-stranded-DNA-specific exonuclease RecJ [Bacteroidota bacterium]
MTKRWKIKDAAPAEIIERFTKEVKVSSVIANLLYHRGITTYDEAKLFFRPQLEQLHDPFLMKDMNKAVARIETAISSGEKILVYGDYDVDGTSSVALVYSFLKTIYGNLDYYIPDRYKEGYGISTAGIDFASSTNFSLIIALDCGIKAVDKVAYAKEKGIDFIICDHHLPGEIIPNAVAVLDPKRKDCSYPYKELSGCGIGFKLIQALAQKKNIPIENLESYLDLVAISIAADIVPITVENRILAYYGLKRLNNSPREGIRAMLELTNMKKELTITDIVFVIGPRINAAGRMESGKKAVELLIAPSTEIAIESGNYLNKNNSDRRDLDIYTTQQALAMIAESTILQQRKTTVLFDPSWHKGVIGIVASRLTETYYRPTVMLTQSNGIVSGSARSVKDFDLYEALSACSDLLEQFGGHKFAAGLTLKPENVEAFKNKFEEVVSSTITDEMLIPEIEIDAEISLNEISPSFYNIIKQFAPFGPGNMNPVFLTENVSDRGYASIVGSNHLKMDVTQKEIKFPAIGFGLSTHYELVAKKNPFTVCYNIREQEWEGKTYLQLQVKDLKK